MRSPPSTPFDAQRITSGVASRITEYWHEWRRRRRWVAELQKAAALGQLDDMLQDVGVTPAELDALTGGPLDAGHQLEILAEAEQIDLSTVPAQELRDAHLTCVRCECREPCKRWLQTGIWHHEGDPRCPNAALLRQ